MAGGSLTIAVATNNMASAVAQRVLCQMSAGNRPYLATATGVGPGIAFVLPEERFPGSLILQRGGTNLLAGYVAGTRIYYFVDNLTPAANQDPNTCPASTNQPVFTSLVTGVGGNPLATTLTYANLGGAGTVNIAWGDGTATNGAAESGTSNHTYPNNGFYTITITDASSPSDNASASFHVP